MIDNINTTPALKVAVEVFEVLELLDEKRLLNRKLKQFLNASHLLDPIVKETTGKALPDHFQEGVFEKKGRARLARLVGEHARRIKKDMPKQSVQFFAVMAVKMIKFVEHDPALTEAYESAKKSTKH